MVKFSALFIATCLVYGVVLQAYSLEDLSLNWMLPATEGSVDLYPVGGNLARSSASGSSESHESLVVSCPAPNNGGLRALLLEIRPLIPAARIKSMVKTALKWDPQLRSLQQLARTPGFRYNVQQLRLSPEFGQLRTVVCQRMYLNLKDYAKFVRTFFHVETSPDSIELFDSDEMNFSGRPGFVGLCQDIIDILPRAQLRAVYQRRIQSDVDLTNTIDFMRSIEFRRVLKNIQSRQEYQELLRMVNAVGVRMAELQKVINYALGRDGPENDGSSNEELIYLLTF